MSLINRIERLEQKREGPEGLTGVLYFHDEAIIVDGQFFSSVEDVPEELRAKYEGPIKVGQVTDENGRTADVVAGCCEGPGHLL